MTKSQALAKGIRDGIEFGPFLIVNGKPSFVKGDGGWGIAPRSAIGQRADGIVLFVVINGRNYKSGILMNKHKIIPVSIFPMFSTIDLHVI